MTDRLLVATPMCWGICTAAYHFSALELCNVLTRSKLEHAFYKTTNESLITRGRDVIASDFVLHYHDYGRLLFIDSDIEFTPSHVAALWNMDADIAVGCYPMKKLGAPYAAWVNRRLLRLEDIEGKADPFRVDHAGTGFMMIKRHVFERMMEAHPEWKHEEGHIGECWGFFQDPLEFLPDDKDNLIRVHMPEDYFFCRRAGELGFQVMMHPKVQLTHWGMHGYDGR